MVIKQFITPTLRRPLGAADVRKSSEVVYSTDMEAARLGLDGSYADYYYGDWDYFYDEWDYKDLEMLDVAP